MWDDRCTMHRGLDFDDQRYKRDMRRATVSDVARPASRWAGRSRPNDTGPLPQARVDARRRERKRAWRPSRLPRGGKVSPPWLPDKDWAMVKLTPEQQEMLCAAELRCSADQGRLGLRGATNLSLAAADARTARSALAMALRNVNRND